MDEKTRAHIDLLKEFDAICVENGLQYSIGNEELKSIIDTGELPDKIDYLAVAMTGGDQERLAEAVNGKIANRFVENFLSNPLARRIETRFYNSETTRINLTNYQYHINHGIYIKIVEAVKEPKSTPVVYLKLATTWKRSCMGERVTKTSEKVATGIMNRAKKRIGRDAVAEKLYNYRKKFYFIDKWEDINDCEFVKLGRYKLRSNILGEIERVKTSEGEFSICRKLYDQRITKNVSRDYMQQTEICDVTIPFEEAMTESFLKHLENAVAARDRFMVVSDKAKEPRKVMARGWNTYLMSRDLVDMRALYQGEKLEELDALLENGDIVAFDKETEIYEAKKKRWKKNNIPFEGVPALDALIEKRNAK